MKNLSITLGIILLLALGWWFYNKKKQEVEGAGTGEGSGERQAAGPESSGGGGGGGGVFSGGGSTSSGTLDHQSSGAPVSATGRPDPTLPRGTNPLASASPIKRALDQKAAVINRARKDIADQLAAQDTSRPAATVTPRPAVPLSRPTIVQKGGPIGPLSIRRAL